MKLHDIGGRWVSCSCGKRGYALKDGAKEVRRRVDPSMRVYRCAQSGMWHLGHAAPNLTREDYRQLASRRSVNA